MAKIIVSLLKSKKLNKGNKLFKLIKENKLIVILILFMIFGMVLGTLFVKFSDENIIEKLDFLFASNFKVRCSQPVITTFTSTLTSSFVFVFCLFLLGLSSWGFIAVPIVPFFRGIGTGLTAGFLYAHYGFKGILFHMLVFLPGIFFSALAIILQSKEAILFSIKIVSKLLPKSESCKLWHSLQDYLKRTGFIFIILVFSSIIDLFFTLVFAGHFNF